MSRGFRKLLLSVALSAIVVAAGIAMAAWLHATKPAAQRTAKKELTPLVRVLPVTSSDVGQQFVGYGSARAERDVLLAAELSGVIVAVTPGLNDGVSVNAGELLVRIDDRRHKQQFKRAEAVVAGLTAQAEQLDIEKTNIDRLASIARQEVDVNREEMRRLAELFEKELASKKEVDFARLAYQQSRRVLQTLSNRLNLIPPRSAALQAKRSAAIADAELARLDIDRCRITAPFSGVVDRLAVHIGDHVLPGSEILRLVDLSLIEIPIELPSSVRANVEAGMRCRLEADSMPGVVWKGSISRVGPAADVRSRTFPAYVEVNNEDQTTPLTPGYFVTAHVEGPTLRQVIAVPRGSILRTGSTGFRSGRTGVDDLVFVVNDHRAHTRAIRVERYIGEQAIVTGDLHPGDKLIVSNLDVLKDGKSVRVELSAPVGPAPDMPGVKNAHGMQPVGVPQSVGYTPSDSVDVSGGDS